MSVTKSASKNLDGIEFYGFKRVPSKFQGIPLKFDSSYPSMRAVSRDNHWFIEMPSRQQREGYDVFLSSREPISLVSLLILNGHEINQKLEYYLDCCVVIEGTPHVRRLARFKESSFLYFRELFRSGQIPPVSWVSE